MSRIDDLEALPIVGNAFHDRQIFELAHTILMDESQPLDVLARAMRKIDETMGMPTEFEEGDDDMVRQAVSDYRHYAAGMEGKCDD